MVVMHLLFGLWPHEFVLTEDFLLIPLMQICFFISLLLLDWFMFTIHKDALIFA